MCSGRELGLLSILKHEDFYAFSSELSEYSCNLLSKHATLGLKN